MRVSRDKIESLRRRDRSIATNSQLLEAYCSADLSLMTEDISASQGIPGLSGVRDLWVVCGAGGAAHQTVGGARGVETLSNPQRDLVL